MEKYIHPGDDKIKNFISDFYLQEKSLEEVVYTVFDWFDAHIDYSRLNNPFYPLQRSDLDVLEMLSGTCGDYSNLLVSVLTALSYDVQYAYVREDCYGNPQDHICAAVWDEEAWKLIDATLPYRKWCGFACPHKEYELLTVDGFWERMKGEEKYWTEKAIKYGNEKYAGLLYAPWVHEEVCTNTQNELECVFYLLVFENKEEHQIYVNSLVYTEEKAISPIMCRISRDYMYFSFSEREAKHIWDSEQWGQEYLEESVPETYRTRYYENMLISIQNNLPRIKAIIEDEFESDK